MKKRLGYFLLISVVLISLVFIIQGTSSKSTFRRFVADLKDKKEKLTWSELLPAYSTNSEIVASRDIFATNKITGLLIVPRVMQFVDVGKARVGWQGELQVEQIYSSRRGASSVGASWKALEEQNKQQAKNLDIFRLALKHPSPDLGPRTNTITGPVYNFPLVRQLAHSFLANVVENLHNRNTSQASEDVKQIIALTRHNKEEPILVAQMVRTAVANVGLSATWELMQSADLDEEMLLDLQSGWQEVDLFDAVQKGFLGERAFGFETFTKIQNSKANELRKLYSPTSSAGSNSSPARGIVWSDVWSDHVVYPWYKMTSADADGLFYMTCLQDSLDSARRLKSGVPWPIVKPLVDSGIKKIDKALMEDKFQRLRFSSIAIPNYSKAFEAVARAETMRRLTITAIALKRYQLRHGELPKNLKLLTPQILSEVPIDPMSAKPICYRLNSDRSHVLYSVGEDGQDDGGIGGMTIWSGKDAVWPIGVEEVPEGALLVTERVK